MKTREWTIFNHLGWRLVLWNVWHWRTKPIKGPDLCVWYFGPFVLSKEPAQ